MSFYMTTIKTQSWGAYAPMALFVLLWGSAAIFTRWGLDHATPFALLTVRFALALLVLLALGWRRKRWLPARGTSLRVAVTGALMIGSYAVCYFQSMARGVTPGLIATLLGVQPILTLLLTERRFSPLRLAGLLLALAGLALVVWQSLARAHISVAGVSLALGALVCMTAGTLLQKGIRQAPADVMPLQYAVSLALCLLFVPFEPVSITWGWGFLVPVIWLGVVISVAAQLLLFRMIHSGDLVNVTSLFYLVPVVTALLDYLVLGNALSVHAMAGMAAILLGLMLVFRPATAQAASMR
jgi:drug/metabolite transporter (DMT)-like permease